MLAIPRSYSTATRGYIDLSRRAGKSAATHVSVQRRVSWLIGVLMTPLTLVLGHLAAGQSAIHQLAVSMEEVDEKA